jgi:type IV pilus assembly protein PilN
MAHLNLLPWREELRRQKQKEFATVAVGAMIVAALVVLLVHMRMEGVIDMQKQRNAYLEQQINTLNQKIGRISFRSCRGAGRSVSIS